MKDLKIFINLTRLNRPIGYLLLFWPCSWGLAYAHSLNKNIETFLFYIVLFFLGAVLMRSAGCIVNDILDKEFDKKVERTKNRPITSNRISIGLGIFYSATLCFLALLVLLNFNKITIILALGSMPLAFTYPLMKRFTYWPQLFLGITFNYGLILGWTAINGEINLLPILFYFGAIFWTLGYDTIYGYQDLKDDEIIGLKSTSIKFKNNPIKFLIVCYTVFLFTILMIGLLMDLNKIFYFIYLIIFLQMFYFQIKKFNPKNELNCLKIFKSNNLLGLLVFLGLVAGKI